MDAEQAARSTRPVALRNGLNRNQNESGRNITSEMPGGRDEAEAPSPTAKSRIRSMDIDDDPDWW